MLAMAVTMNMAPRSTHPYPQAEAAVVADHLKYLLLGNDTPLFKFNHVNTNTNNNNTSSDINIQLNIDASIHLGPLQELVQLALILKKLSLLSNPPYTQPSSSHQSSTLTAFHACVKTSVLDFNKFINDTFNTQPITNFISIKYLLSDHFVQFKFIHFLNRKFSCDDIDPSKFLSIIYDYSLFGDSLIKKISSQYFSESSKPYFKILSDWLLQGILNPIDSDLESFFVSFSNTRNTNENFIFNKDLIPSFLNSSDSFKIFQIGKSIHFLKIYLNDKIWCNNFYNTYQNFHFNDLNINEIYFHVISHLNDILLSDFKSNIYYMNKFLLFNQGDFINIIIDKGFNILNNNSSNLSTNQLIYLLQDSIDSSSIIHNYKTEIYNNLDARLLNLSNSNNKGWDLFTLDYKLSNQIGYLINNSYKEYLRIFNFLFKIYKIKFKLSKIWKSSNLIFRKFNKFPNNNFLNKSQKKFHLIRYQFSSFINSVYSFIVNEIISLNFNKFNENLNTEINSISLLNNKLLPFKNNQDKKLFNLDDLILIHNDYIKSISRSKLFYNSNNSPQISEVLFKILTVLENFLNLSDDFQSLLLIHLNNPKKKLINNLKSLILKLNNEIINNFENDLTLLINLLHSSNDESLKNFAMILET